MATAPGRIIALLAIVAVGAFACSVPASPEASGSGQPWRIVLLGVTYPSEVALLQPDPGWRFLEVLLALENTGDGFQALSFHGHPIDDVTITTAEGYSYPTVGAWFRAGDAPNHIGTWDYPVPPGFRVRVIDFGGPRGHQTNRLTFKVAAASSGYVVHIPGWATIDLDDLEAIEFPTDLPADTFYTLPAAFTVPGKGRLVVTDFNREASNDTAPDDGFVTMLLTNESQGYDQEFEVACATIGDDGILRRGLYISGPTYTVGPGQELQVRDKLEVSKNIGNLKLILTGDVQAVINLD